MHAVWGLVGILGMTGIGCRGWECRALRFRTLAPDVVWTSVQKESQRCIYSILNVSPPPPCSFAIPFSPGIQGVDHLSDFNDHKE